MLINLVKIRFDDVKVGFSLFSNSVGVYTAICSLFVQIDVIPYCHVKPTAFFKMIFNTCTAMYTLSLPNIWVRFQEKTIYNNSTLKLAGSHIHET